MTVHPVLRTQAEPVIGTGTILDQIGNTPLVRIRKIAERLTGVEIYAKIEGFNPGGSVKDRPALYMIREGIRTGQLTGDKAVLEATSGNMGIAMAMIGSVLGYKVVLCVPRNVSEERRKIIRAFDATVVYTDPLEGSDGAIRAAQKLYGEDGNRYYRPDQYNNPFNTQAHYETTGVEILRQCEGRITHFVAGIGTGGTIMGAGRRLKEHNKNIALIAVEPDCPLHGLEGLKHMATSIVPGIYKEESLDGKIQVSTEAAYDMVHRLAREEGLFVGQSSGAAMYAALRLAEEIREGIIVTIFPDGGEKYLSTRLWEP